MRRRAALEFAISGTELDEIRWDLIPVRDFRDPPVKEAKQSELLIREFFPWSLVERIGTHSDGVAGRRSENYSRLRPSAYRAVHAGVVLLR